MNSTIVADSLASHSGKSDRREWHSVGSWLHPGERIVIVREDEAAREAATTDAETNMTATQRAAMQQALEFCEELQGGCADSDDGTVEAITVWCPELISTIRAALAEPVAKFHPFVVKHYISDDLPTIKGNGFDFGVCLGREEAEQFVAWVNARITTLPTRQPVADSRSRHQGGEMTETQRTAMQQALDALKAGDRYIDTLEFELSCDQPPFYDEGPHQDRKKVQAAIADLEAIIAALAEPEPPIWQTLAEIGASAPAGTWDAPVATPPARQPLTDDPLRSELRERAKRARQAALIEAAEICDRHANEWPQTIAAVLRATAKEKGND